MDFGLASATDNLYKFIFLGGLTLLVFSLMKPYEQKSSIDTKVTELEVDTLLLNKELKDVHVKVESLKGDTASLLDQSKALGIEKKSLIKGSEEFNNLLEKFDSIKVSFSEKCSSIKGEIAKLDSLNTALVTKNKVLIIEKKNLKRKSSFFYMISLIGAICAIIGGFLWYGKTQRHTDKILKKEADS